MVQSKFGSVRMPDFQDSGGKLWRRQLLSLENGGLPLLDLEGFFSVFCMNWFLWSDSYHA